MHLAYLFLIIFSAIVYLLWLYNICISLKGFGTVRGPKPATSLRRFAVIVPAHNEEQVIQDLLHSIYRQSYPSTHFDIFVSADNCTDRTAELSSRVGATVFERRDDADGGKAGNIRFALAQIELSAYDAVVLFDADNLVHKYFLTSMNNFLEAEPTAAAVQGYLDVKNPRDNWITVAYTMTYLFTNRFWQLARSRLGLSALLGGTGAVIRTAALLKHGWKTQSLTEDIEFTVKLILEGKRVFWNHEAVVYDEKPVSYTAALRQRQRWIQGQFWTLIRYLRPLVVALVRGDMGPGRFQCIDIMIYLMVPGQMLITYAAMLFFGVSSVAGALLLGLTVESVVFGLATLSLLAYLFVMQAIVAPSLYHGRVSLGYIRYFFHVLASIAFVLPAHLLGAANWHNQRTWVKTQHTRSIRIEERSR